MPPTSDMFDFISSWNAFRFNFLQTENIEFNFFLIVRVNYSRHFVLLDNPIILKLQTELLRETVSVVNKLILNRGNNVGW